jgi:hypothetical protein
VGQVVGVLLPLAVVVAVSPIPIVAVVLMLLARRTGGTAVGFLLGWVAGIAGVTVLVLLLASPDADGRGESSHAAAWSSLLLGAALVLLAVRQWRSRPGPGDQPSSPRWMAAVDRFTAARAGGLGLALSALNPKALAVCVAAGAAIAGGGLSGAEATWAVVVFTGVAASTVAVPVLAGVLRRERMAGPLDALRGWLTVHNAVVSAALLLGLGAALVGQGLSGLR